MLVVILTVASFKGGVGKTTTAIHLAAYFSQKAPTVLVDGDPNRSSTSWANRGNPAFRVVGEHQIAIYARQCEHLIIDTKARPEPQDLKALAEGCDLLVLPCTPDPFSLDALMMTIEALQKLGANAYRILLTIVPPRPQPDGDNARRTIAGAQLPIFKAEIRRTVAFQRAALDGTTVNQIKSNDMAGLGWRDYEAIGEEIEELYGRTIQAAGKA
jgi:chromosome partitioning protein